MKRVISVVGIVCLISGCASSLQTFDGLGKKSLGIPISSPALVKITQTTSYKVVKELPKEFEGICDKEVNSEYKFLALGERSYIGFNPGPFGKGEFKVDFNDSGTLKSVSLNSDAIVGVDKFNDVLSTVLPYIAEKKPAGIGVQAAVKNLAQEIKDEHCIKIGTVVDSVVIVEPEHSNKSTQQTPANSMSESKN